MKGKEKRDGMGQSTVDNVPHIQICYGTQVCDAPSCWDESVTVVDGTRLCQVHRKAMLGVSS